MNACQHPYYELFQEIQDYDGRRLLRDILRPWITANAEECDWLRAFAVRPGSPIPPASQEDLWRLYALSRVAQLLCLGFAPRRMIDVGRIGWPETSWSEYADFMLALGFTPIDASGFHPVYHEVVRVEPAEDPNTPITLRSIDWPGHRLGPLVFKRAGCSVCGGTNHIRKTVAESSTLYWAYVRANRPADDLSHGWGSMSQWRTSLRRDYVIDGRVYYNVDARAFGEDDGKLTDSEVLELLRHRCFVRCEKSHQDLFPYRYRHEEPI